MKQRGTPVSILMAEDDPDDRLLTQEALEEARLANPLYFVKDGEELIEFLCHEGRYTDSSLAPRPGVILLDLNMPRKDGREALKEIKENPHLRRIPIIVLTTSKDEEDILRSYDMGVSGYVTKPVNLEQLADVIRMIGKYWFEIVELPPY